MANFFVSTNGSDITGDGLSVDTAWRTINHALSTIPQTGSFHYVYVEVGVYRLDDEGGGLGYNRQGSGIVSHYQEFAKVIGDVNGEQFGTKGVVRVTACDSSEQMQELLYTDVYSTKIEFINLHFDGYSGSYNNAQIDNAPYVTVTFRNCHITNLSKIYYGGRFHNCLLEIGGRYGGNYNIYGYNRFYDCIFPSIGYQYSTVSTIEFYNCLFLSGDYLYCGASKYINCIAIGVRDAFKAIDNTSVNNLAIGCQYAFAYGTPKNCIAIDCERPFYSSTATDCYYNGIAYSTGGATGVSKSYDIGMPRFDYDLLRRAYKPLGALFQNKGSRDVTVMDDDIIGLPQNSIDGSGIDVGAYRVDTITEDVDNLSLEIEREGIKPFKLPCKAGLETTLTCDIASSGTTERPEIRIYDQDGTLIDSDVATADTDTLTVSITPTTDYVYRIWLYATDSGVGASTEFSDIKVNGVQGVINSQGEIYPVIARLEDVETIIIPNLWDEIDSTIKLIRLSQGLLSTIILAATVEYYPIVEHNVEHVNPLDPIEVDLVDRFHRDKISVKAIVSPDNYNELYDALEDYDQLFIEFNIGDTAKQYEVTKILSMPVLVDIGRQYISGTEMTFESIYTNALPYSFDSYRFLLSNVVFL